MSRATLPLAAALALALAACGSATDPGSGTRTLFATVEITGKPDNTKVEVELMARGNPVVGANVVFRDLERDLTVIADRGGKAGNYRAMFPGHARTLSLRIVAADDHLEATLEGPADHVITRPPNNAIVRRRDFEVLRVEWEADGGADRVEVKPEKGSLIRLEGDPFAADVPLGALPNGEQKISVTRETSVELRGGTSGSRMRARYEVDNRFTLEG